MNITTVFLLAGGLGLFLYGMKLMSEGLEQVAGSRMRSILEFFTKNRFVGMLVGILFTAVVQSSSATTVMVVSFVNSGLMTLSQATGVILGANIGTTVTGQLIAFNLSDAAPFFVFAGVIMVMFCKRQEIQKIGNVILGFGILFMGLGTMSSAMSSLKDSPQIVDMLGSLTNPFLAVLAGFVITAILQSSSATVGIVIVMASQGLLQFPICFFLIMGCNMGSCVSALLASLGGKKDAKRAAWIHFLVNIFGSTVVFLILMFALDPIANEFMRISGGNVGRAVANAHTMIKVFEAAIMFPFMNLVVKLTCKIIPGKDSEEGKYELQFIGKEGMIRPTTAVPNAIQEICHMANIAKENLSRSLDAFWNLDNKEVEKVYQVEEQINYMNQAITDYLVKINEMVLPHKDAVIIGGLFHVVNDVERIGDHAENFAEAAKTVEEKQLTFSEKGLEQLKEMKDMTLEILDQSIETFSTKSPEHMREILDLENAIDAKEIKLQKAHVKRLTKEECTPESGMIYSDILSELERVADHATNIAFSIVKPEELTIKDEEDE